MSYAKIGSPFDFQSSLSESQKEAFYTWINKRTKNFADEQKWWQIRAHQLRKTAGDIEKWYKEKNDEPLTTRWDKAPWAPGGDGHLPLGQKDSQIPSVVVGELKDTFREQMKRDEEGMFQMGHLRTMIEKAEDKAHYCSESKAKVKELMGKLDTLFGSPEYESILVKDKSNLYKGSPKYRVNPLQPPTTWELEISTGGVLKEKN